MKAKLFLLELLVVKLIKTNKILVGLKLPKREISRKLYHWLQIIGYHISGSENAITN